MNVLKPTIAITLLLFLPYKSIAITNTSDNNSVVQSVCQQLFEIQLFEKRNTKIINNQVDTLINSCDKKLFLEYRHQLIIEDFSIYRFINLTEYSVVTPVDFYYQLCLFTLLYPQFFVQESNQILSVNELSLAIQMLSFLINQSENCLYIMSDVFIQQLDKLWSNVFSSYIYIYMTGPNYNVLSDSNTGCLTQSILQTGKKLIELHQKIYYVDYYNSAENVKFDYKQAIKTNFKRYDILVVN